MTIKKLTEVTFILTIAFFVIGWFVSRPILAYLSSYLISFTSNSEFVATKLGGQFRIHLVSSIAFALLPFFAFLITLLISKAKKHKLSLKSYFVNLTYIIIGFMLGGLIRILFLAIKLKSLDSHDFPHLVNSIPLEMVKFHDFGIIVAFTSCVMIFLLTKKRA